MSTQSWSEERDVVALQRAARRLGWLRLAELVAESYSVPVQDLLGHARSQRATEARQMFYLVLYDYLYWSAGAIARTVGRHDASVRHGLAALRRSLAKREVAYTLSAVEEEIRTRAGRLPPRGLREGG